MLSDFNLLFHLKVHTCMNMFLALSSRKKCENGKIHVASVPIGEAVLTCTNSLCFGAKFRKIGIPIHTPDLLKKVGYKGVFITET